VRATGIVRRIDELGRIVIPKEIRRTMHIRETDSLEIYTDREGMVILRKYSPMEEIGELAERYAQVLFQVSGHSAMITDRDRFIACAGPECKHFAGMELHPKLQDKLEGRKAYLAERGTEAYVPLFQKEDDPYLYQVVAPIICQGDLIGCVALTELDRRKKLGEVELKLVTAAATFLAKYMEH